MNRGHARRQIDTSKPLIKVESADDFYNKENEEAGDVMHHERSSSLNSMGDLKKKNAAEAADSNTLNGPSLKKNEIIIPVSKEVEEAIQASVNLDVLFFRKRKTQSHYVRIDYCQLVPCPDIYEPTDKDLQFIKELNDKISKSSKSPNEITAQNFSKILEAWENLTDKGDIISLNRALTAVENSYPPALKDNLSKIYEYWKAMRERYQRPILRKFWKTINKDDNNPNAAFRVRENPKMKTRRNNRTNDSENLEKMKTFRQDLDVVVTLLGNVRYREMLKLEINELANLKFERDFPTNQSQKLVERFKETYENEAYLKLRNKMKQHNDSATMILNRPDAETVVEDPFNKPLISVTKVPVKVNPPATYQNTSEELNFDLGSFIATILDEAYTKDITPVKVRDLDLPAVPNEFSTNGMDIEKPLDIIERQPSIKPPIKSPFIEQGSLPLMEQIKSRSTSIINQKPPKPHPLPFDDKAVLRYRIRRRIGRQKRILLDRIFDEDENSLSAHHKDFYNLNSSQRDILITPEVAQKLPNGNLRELYLSRFERFKNICPFNDSEEENDMTESTKVIKNLATNFKNFMKQRRPVNPVV